CSHQGKRGRLHERINGATFVSRFVLNYNSIFDFFGASGPVGAASAIAHPCPKTSSGNPVVLYSGSGGRRWFRRVPWTGPFSDRTPARAAGPRHWDFPLPRSLSNTGSSRWQVYGRRLPTDGR